MTRGLRPSVRFDVFRRDAFTCSYCGRKPPEATLEVDHIIAISEGGTDDPENLTTACFECNRGKAAKSLNTPPPAIPDIVERTALILERERQLLEYHDALNAISSRQDESVNRILDYWESLWGECTGRELPSRSAVRRYLDDVGEDAIYDAIDAAGAKFRYVGSSSVRYFFGVLKWKSAEAKGLVVPCAVCEKRVMLEPGDDPNESWIHTGCDRKEAAGG